MSVPSRSLVPACVTSTELGSMTYRTRHGMHVYTWLSTSLTSGRHADHLDLQAARYLPHRVQLVT